MCEATTIIMGITAVIGAATSVYQMQQQEKATERNNKAAEQQMEIEAERARRDAAHNQANLKNKALEEASAFQQKKEKIRLDALREQSATRAKAAESGVGGVTSIRSFVANDIAQDLALSDIEKSEDFSSFNVHQNQRNITNPGNDRLQNAHFTMLGKLRQKPSGFDYLSAGVSGAAGGLEMGQSIGGAFSSKPAPPPSNASVHAAARGAMFAGRI